MRLAALVLAVSGLPVLACSSGDTAFCPGNTVATFRLKGPLLPKGDRLVASNDPVPDFPDCTPGVALAIGSPLDTSAPVAYPLLAALDAKLAADPSTGAAALCRSNGTVYSGTRTGETHYAVGADAAPAIPCATSACAARLRVTIAGDVLLDAGGAPEGFDGVLVEALTEDRGACDTCLPSVPNADPPVHACAARYHLTGTLR